MDSTTLWVRPGPLDYHYAGPYGRGDGSSYSNAIAGLMNVPWDTPDLQVIVADQHVKRWTGESIVAKHASIPIVSGTADTPVIVRGDASRFDDKARDGVIIGGMIDEKAPEWTDHGNGVWSRTSTRFNFSNQLWGLRVGGTEAQLDDYVVVSPVASLEACEASEDTSFLAKAGNPWTLYVHFPDGMTPATQFVIPGYGYRFNNANKSSLIFYGIQFGIFVTESGSHQEFRRCKLRFGKILVGVTGDKPGYIVDRCHLQHSGSGVYLFSINGTPPQISNSARVTSCEIYDMGKEWFNEARSDAHAIAARHGINGYYIDGCRTERTGHPIMMYNYSWSSCKDVHIRRTVCRGVHPHYRAPTWNGIALNPANSHSSPSWDNFDSTNNIVERCYVDGTNMNYPIRNAMVVDYKEENSVFKVINCQVDGGEYGICMANGLATDNRVSTGYLRGNVLRGQTAAFLLQAGTTTERKNYVRNGGLDSDNNTFITQGSNPETHARFGSTARTFAQWQFESVRFDPRSTVK